MIRLITIAMDISAKTFKELFWMVMSPRFLVVKNHCWMPRVLARPVKPLIRISSCVPARFVQDLGGSLIIMETLL